MLAGGLAVQFFLGRKTPVESNLDWSRIQREGLLGFAIEHCLHEGVPVPRDIRLIWFRSIAFELRCRQVLEQIADLQVPVVVFKGCSLIFHAYARPGLRACGDIDLATPPQHRPSLKRGLERLGFEECSTGQFQNAGLGVDLHEHPLHQLTDLVGPKAQEWWGQTTPLWDGRNSLHRLSVEHEFVLTLFHASKHAFSRASWVIDAALLAEQADSDRLAAAVRHFRAQRQLAYVGECLQSWFDWELPSALQRLAPPRLTRLERRFLKVVVERRAPDYLGMLTPLSSAHSLSAAIRFLARSLYPDRRRFWQRTRQLLRMANTWRTL